MEKLFGAHEISAHLRYHQRVAPQRCRRVERRDHVPRTEAVDAAPQAAYRLGSPKQCPSGEVPQCDDHFRFDELELGFEVRPARLDLVRLGVAVARGPAFDAVAYVAVVAL